MTIPAPLEPQSQPGPVTLDWLPQPPAPAVAPRRGEPAHLVRRGGALLIDVVLLLGAAILVALLIGERTVYVLNGDGEVNSGVALTLSPWQVRGVLLGWFLYLITSEVAFGTTLGKRVLGLMVLQDTWAEVSVRGAVLRQLTHLLPLVVFINPVVFIVYGVGAVLAATSEDRQRLGDRLAGTIVVRRPTASEVEP